MTDWKSKIKSDAAVIITDRKDRLVLVKMVNIIYTNLILIKNCVEIV